MNNSPRLLIATLLSAILVQSVAYAVQPKIKLAGRKDLVLTSESRVTVLEIGYSHLAEKDDAFVAYASELTNPYGFRKPVVEEVPVVIENGEEVPQVVSRPVVTYDDASVLEVVAATFAKRVRGSIARGATSFLQIDGGSMLRPGTSFPVTIPQAKDQSFTLKISEITPDSYTLQIGEATKVMSYENSQSGSSGNIRFTN